VIDDTRMEQRWEELEQWGREPRLNELDALMWRTDRHPGGSWSGAVLHVLDRPPEWGRLRDAHQWFVQVVPRFAQRVIDPVVPVGTPMWADDPSFDLDFHLRRVRVPEPGTRRQLLDLVQTIALTPLDRARPPWEGFLIEGLEDGRAAYVMHAHHVFMDGMALARLHEHVLNGTREHDARKPRPNPAPGASLSPIDVATRQLARQVNDAPGAATRLVGTLARGVRSPSAALRYARSLGRVAAPPEPNRSLVLRGGRQRMWRFGMLECELADLRRAGKAAGGTVNDTFVCALLGGLRHYCAAFGEDLPDVPISMPVAMRKPDEASGGNKFAGAFFLVPSSISDPAQRIRAMHERVDRMRREPALDFVSALMPALNRTPSSIASTVLRSVGGAVLTTSSWPGITSERYMAGAKFERMFVFASLPGTVMTGAMCAHNGVCCIAINADGEVFTDLDLLWECMQRGLDEVLELGTGA